MVFSDTLHFMAISCVILSNIFDQPFEKDAAVLKSSFSLSFSIMTEKKKVFVILMSFPINSRFGYIGQIRHTAKIPISLGF